MHCPGIFHGLPPWVFSTALQSWSAVSSPQKEKRLGRSSNMPSISQLLSSWTRIPHPTLQGLHFHQNLVNLGEAEPGRHGREGWVCNMWVTAWTRGQTHGGWVPFSADTNYMTLGVFPICSKPSFPHLYNEANDSFYLVRLLWVANELALIKPLARCAGCSKYSVNISVITEQMYSAII